MMPKRAKIIEKGTNMESKILLKWAKGTGGEPNRSPKWQPKSIGKLISKKGGPREVRLIQRRAEPGSGGG